jgi:hypothetical protein
MSVKITCVGDRVAAHRITATGERAHHQRGAMSLAGRFAGRSISGVPVRTGRLRASTRGGPEHELVVTDRGFDLASSVPYARFVFGGTRNMRAHPPRVNERTIAREAATAVSADLRRAR